MIFDKLFISFASAETAASTASTAADPNAASMGAGSLITTLIMMVAMVAIFYFMLIRPQRKKDKQVKEMLAALKPGDRITTIGGIYGTIKAIKDDTITLYVGSDRMEMVVARWAIRGVEDVSIKNDGEELT